MTLKIHDLKEIIKIANLLDKKRLFKEADILDQIIIKEDFLIRSFDLTEG